MDEKDPMRRALTARRRAHFEAHGAAEAQALASLLRSSMLKRRPETLSPLICQRGANWTRSR
jgi:5-formyltetrahydrofolate cyclo-ligase